MASTNSNWKGWLREKLISLPDQKRQVLTIRNPPAPTRTSQGMAIHHALHGNAVAKVDGGGQQARGRGNRHADKILASGRPGLRGCGIVADVEARQPRCSAEQKQETDEGSGLHQVHVQLRIHRVGQKMESPDEGQQAGRHAEGDDVGQRIQLLAEIAGGVGHARNAPVERIEGNGEQNGDRGPVKMRLRIAGDGAAYGFDGLR